MTAQTIFRPEVRPVLDAVDAARRAIGATAGVSPRSLGTDELSEAVARLATLESQAAALRLSLLAEADRREVAAALGMTGTDSWAAALTGSTRAVMAGGVWLARMLDQRYTATRDAFADGAVNEEQARVIVRAAEQLPDEVGDEQRRAAEAALVVKAVNGMDARGLRQAARRMLDVVSRELADAHEATQLRAEERRAEAETWFTLHDNGDGTFSGRFVIPELHGHLLRHTLERLTSPRRLTRNAAGDVVQDATVPGDALNWSERLGLGFTELVEHLPTSGFGANAVTLLVHLDHRHLLDGLGSARLDSGAHISAGEARRLACNAGLVPAVLGSRSEPLDLGTTVRLHNTAQRRASSVTHATCAAEGCDRPFAWCDMHHRHAWGQGGATSLENSLPLCGFHHRRAHDPRFDMTVMGPGEARFRRRR